MALEVATIENEWIPLPDGRRLACRIWSSDFSTPSPVIVEYIPYGKRAGTAFDDETTHATFAGNGYACVRVDVAGTGESDGHLTDEYSEQELFDGESVVAWAAQQPWSNGSVALMGISWGGINALQIAALQPDALRAVITVASATDRYEDDCHYQGGCLKTDNLTWATMLAAFAALPPDPELRDDWRDEWLSRLEGLPFFVEPWMDHDVPDHYWNRGSVANDWSQIQVPILAIGGWADPYSNTPANLVRNVPSPVAALVGPWEHRYPHLSAITASDFHAEVVSWLERWMSDTSADEEDPPRYRAFVEEHNISTDPPRQRVGRWISEPVLPSPNVKTHTFHLGDARLDDVPAQGTVTISPSPTIGARAGVACPGLGLVDELAGDQADDDQLSTAFNSGVLAEPLEILGRPILRITFTVTGPTAQLCARVCDVSPEGVSQRITFRPFDLGLATTGERCLEPGRVYQAELTLDECAHRLRTGHRLRLALSSSYWPIVWPSPDNAEVLLSLHECELDIPQRANDSAGEITELAAPTAFRTLDAEVMRAGDRESRTTETADGRIVHEAHEDFGELRNPVHGLISSSRTMRRYSIDLHDPSQATHDEHMEFTLRRGDFDIAVVSHAHMSSDSRHYTIDQTIEATQNQIQVSARSWTRRFARR